MIRFYAPDILETHTLPESDSAHAARVLRLKEGDSIQAVDGRGNVYTAVITDANKRHMLVEITDTTTEQRHWKPRITLMVAPTKNMDRMEWLAEKAVEIGVDRIVMFISERSERKVVKPERIEKIMVSAMKQSLKAIMPELVAGVTLESQLKEEGRGGQKFICYCDENTPRLLLPKALKVDEDVTILIGPEGDFSPREVKLAIDNGFVPVTLGDTRLRTETAALYALATVHVVNQLHQS